VVHKTISSFQLTFNTSALGYSAVTKQSVVILGMYVHPSQFSGPVDRGVTFICGTCCNILPAPSSHTAVHQFSATMDASHTLPLGA